MQQIGKYRVNRLIGEGGMGRVYEASDPIINRRVAIKTISQQVLQNPETRARFIREAQAAGQLSHPNLITIHDIGEDGDLPFIVMEYLEGEELTGFISKGRLALDVKLRLMIDMCQGLAYAHEKGLIHRDIKPANIFVTMQQQVKILDFGLARGLESELTQTGNVVGTPSYMAPEQVRGEPIDQRADIFSAGVVLYELLSGRKPFKADSVAALIFQVLEHQPEPVDRLDPNLPGELATVVQRALAKNPAERYQRVDEMLADLKRIKNHAESTVLLTAPPAAAARPSEIATVIRRAPAAATAAPVAAAAPEPTRGAAVPVAPVPSEVPTRQPASRNWLAIGGIAVLAAVAIVLVAGRLNRSVTVPSLGNANDAGGADHRSAASGSRGNGAFSGCRGGTAAGSTAERANHSKPADRDTSRAAAGRAADSTARHRRHQSAARERSSAGCGTGATGRAAGCTTGARVGASAGTSASSTRATAPASAGRDASTTGDDCTGAGCTITGTCRELRRGRERSADAVQERARRARPWRPEADLAESWRASGDGDKSGVRQRT